ncbi:hypothetical protein FKP32DRAFT_1560577 [Trametes sanguinea]|nr:hypothetical protein FKP32DRAFT_1560577 [Trametes sanguinea]
MDYDRYDAFLHHIFKQTQGDAWFRPNEDNIAVGVALRVDNGEYRVFPYENLGLEPFEAAVRLLNPAVAVKVRSAAVHAAFSEVGPDDKSIYIDANTRIQILDTMVDLPTADKEQSAAFIRDERVLVVWSDSIDTIIPTCHDFEERLIKLLWRSRPGAFPGSHPTSASSHPASVSGSVSGHSLQQINTRLSQSQLRRNSVLPNAAPGTPGLGTPADVKEAAAGAPKTVTKRTWWGGKKTVTVGGSEAASAVDAYADVEAGPERRRPMLLAPIYNGLAAGLSLFFIGNGINVLLQEVELDGNYVRFALCALVPFFFCVSLFFSIQIIQNVSMCIGPIAQYHQNSKYYSAVKPRPNKIVDNNLPHITIQMPVYKESLETVLAPSIESLKKAMQTYARQGGTSTIFVNDDGLRLLPVEERDARILFYANHGIGWVARPKHDDSPGGFKRAGRFKKASNMNYALALSLKAEKHLDALLAREKAARASTTDSGSGSRTHGINEEMRYGMQYRNRDGEDQEQLNQGYGERNGIAYFTRRINKCISLSCANGEVAPFVGHNAFLRWRALQDAAFVDPADGQEKIWSESNVSEDFDMALRLQMRGYIIRWATYSKGGFKEGVSLTVDDELNRWQKYAYGCNELLFNPLVQWWRRGPIAHQIHKFLWSNAPLHYKFSMLAYMFSYYGIAASITVSVVNYVLLGFEFPVDGYYIHSFEIWLATTVVFIGSGNVGYTLLEYRLGEKSLFASLFQNILWIPFFFFFFGGLSIPVTQAILAHLFSYNMTWGATKKEVERSNFFKEVPKIFKRFWFSWLVSWILVAGMVILSTPIVPLEWRIDGSAWAVIFPLAVVVGCHILFPIVLNPWLMIFSY